MSKSLRDVIVNYRAEPLLGDNVHVKAKKDGKVVFDGHYKIFASIETNYSRLAIIWPEDRVVPGEFRDYYGSSNMYPVEIEYFEEDNIVYFSGEYSNEPYKVVVQLPEKRY